MGGCRFGPSGHCFPGHGNGLCKSWRCKRIHTSFTLLIKKLHSNSVLLEYVEWRDDGNDAE